MLTEAERHLIHILQGKQRDLDEKDVPFSERLTIGQGHWSLLKNGKRHIGRKTARKIIRAFPDLWREVHDVEFPREGEAA